MTGLPSFRDICRRFPALQDLRSRAGLHQIPYVQQVSTTECGAACLSMVLKYHGRHVPLDSLRQSAVSARDTTSAQIIIDVAKQHGLVGRAVAVDLDQLSHVPRGSILHWHFTHFVVLDRVHNAAVSVVDPNRGRRRIDMTAFSRAFSGVAIVFELADDFQSTPPPRWGMLRYARRLLTERGFLPHILLTSVLLQAFGLATPLVTGILIDEIVPTRDYDLLFVVVAGALGLAGFHGLTLTVRSTLLLVLRTRLDARMTLGFLSHLFSLPFDFFQRRSTGDLLMRLGSNTTVRETLTGAALSTVLDGLLAGVYLVVLLALHPSAAALTLLLAFVQIGLLVFTRHKQRQYLALSMEAQAESQSYLIEMLSAVEIVKSMGLESGTTSRWSHLFVRQLNVSLDQGRLGARLEGFSSFVRSGSSTVLLGFAAYEVLRGDLSLGNMMAITAIASGFLGPLLNLVTSATQLQQLGIYLERLSDVLDTPSEGGRTTRQSVGELSGSIDLSNVSFRYGPASPLVLDSLSVSVTGGEFLAIVGRSGSGKSTLARLLVGLYEPTSGTVCFDGRDLSQLDVTAVRRQIGVVSQQAQLFAGTIRSNIAFAVPDLTLEQIIAIAKIAQIHDDIMAMPMGYDTPLIGRGASLSGGQQQRLALARALATRPRVLLLDEATSQLDASTERAVQNQLARMPCTRIVIAHRLSTIVNADRILVLDKGQVVEEGTHSELISMAGAYMSLVTAQMGSRST